MEFVPAFEKALKEVVLQLKTPSQQDVKGEDFYIGFEGKFAGP